MKNKLGAQLYTIRDYLQTPGDIAESFKKIKEIGYEAVQYSGASIYDAKEIRKMADDAGIKIICTHIPMQAMKENIGKVIDDHHTLGCEFAGIGMMPGEYQNEEGLKTFIKEYNEIGKTLKENGLGTTYHIHSYEFEKYNGKTIFEALIENGEYFSIIADTYWMQAGGVDVVDYFKKYKSKFEVIHFKDMIIEERTQKFCEIGNGNLNWKGILDEVKNSDIKYYFVEQDVCKGNPFDSLKISYDYLVKM